MVSNFKMIVNVKRYLPRALGPFLFFLILPTWALAQQMVFKDHGSIVKTLSLGELEKIAGVQTVTVHDPNEDQDVTYKGFPLKAIFENVYGVNWSRNEEVLFTCQDGYQPSVPVERFHQHDSYLAFVRVGSQTFSITNKSENNKKVNLGPFYLIWDDLKQKGAATVGGVSWPYQLESVDMTTFAERFPRLAPPQKSAAKIKRGFLAFRQNCMECHSLNGDGGNIGPELNFPVNVTEYYKESLLRKWIDNPQSIRFKTAMPPLRKDIENRAHTIDDIIGYVKAMRNQKIKPKAQ